MGRGYNVCIEHTIKGMIREFGVLLMTSGCSSGSNRPMRGIICEFGVKLRVQPVNSGYNLPIRGGGQSLNLGYNH